MHKMIVLDDADIREAIVQWYARKNGRLFVNPEEIRFVGGGMNFSSASFPESAVSPLDEVLKKVKTDGDVQKG